MTTGGSQLANHILLVGFMGSGKSTVGCELARMTGRPLIDTDDVIERMAGKAIPEIFAGEGEEGFRERECECLLRIADEQPSIVSCGGGIVTTETCRELLGRLGFTVFLEVDAGEAVERIGASPERPLLKGVDEMRALLAQRLPWYREVADLRIDTSGREPAAIADEIIAALRERGVL